MNSSNSQSQNKLSSWRIYAFLLAFGVAMVVFVFRLFTLQIIQGEQWVQEAENNRTEAVAWYFKQHGNHS